MPFQDARGGWRRLVARLLPIAFLGSTALVVGLALAAHRRARIPLLTQLTATSQWPVKEGQSVMILVFQPGDCNGRVQAFVERLELLRYTIAGINVRGVMIGSPREPEAGNIARSAVHGMDVVRHQGHGPIDLILRSLGVQSTPVLLAFDSTHAMRFVIGSDSPAQITAQLLSLTLPTATAVTPRSPEAFR